MSSSSQNQHQGVRCRLCGQVIGAAPLSLGELPVCNGFGKTAAVDRRVSLNVVECETCRLVQLSEAPSPATLVPRVPWIRYREPEAHLDTLANELLALRPEARNALGTGPFEQPLLSRLAARGIETQALALDMPPSPDRYPYLESWEASLNEPRLMDKAGQLGPFDIVSCRYIVEHTADPVRTLQALKPLLQPGGLLLVEVPDSSTFLTVGDYCFLWEEHSSYFVADTLQHLAETAGYRVVALLRYPGALEDALVAVMEIAAAPAPTYATRSSASLFPAFRDGFAATRDLLRTRLGDAAGPDRNRIALFGVGHHGIMFVNAFGLADVIALAIDDDAEKAGFFPPGLHVPVIGSDRLLADERIRLCLLAVAPHIEGRVRDKLAPLVARGVALRSIYAALENSILKDSAP
jgi:SAM-dependent methyltransferase